MVHGTQQRLRDIEDMLPVELSGERVESVSEFKYLGVVLDRHLSFDNHTTYLRRKVMVKMKMLGRIRQYVSQSLAIMLYNSLILPDFDYADIIYDSFSKHNANKLQVMQNKCLKLCIKCDRRIPSDELHARAKMPLLSTRRNVHTCNFVYRGLNNQLSKGVNAMFKYPEERANNNTRSTDNKQLAVPVSRLQLGKGNIKIRGPEYFNSIPLEIKTAPIYNSFKARIKGCEVFNNAKFTHYKNVYYQ